MTGPRRIKKKVTKTDGKVKEGKQLKVRWINGHSVTEYLCASKSILLKFSHFFPTNWGAFFNILHE